MPPRKSKSKQPIVKEVIPAWVNASMADLQKQNKMLADVVEDERRRAKAAEFKSKEQQAIADGYRKEIELVTAILDLDKLPPDVAGFDARCVVMRALRIRREMVLLLRETATAKSIDRLNDAIERLCDRMTPENKKTVEERDEYA